MKKIISSLLSALLITLSIPLQMNTTHAAGFVNATFSKSGSCPSLTFNWSVEVTPGHESDQDETYVDVAGLTSISVTSPGAGNAFLSGNKIFLSAVALSPATYNVEFTAQSTTNEQVDAYAKVNTVPPAFSDTDNKYVYTNCDPAQPAVITLGAQSTEHDNTQPNQDFTKTDTCSAPGSTITFMGISASGSDVVNIQSATGIGTSNASIEYDVRSADGKPKTTGPIFVTCNSSGGNDTENYNFEFTNAQPTYNSSGSVGHTHGAAQNGQVTITAPDVNSTDEVSVTFGSGTGFSLNSSTPGNPGQLVVDYSFADGDVGPKTFTFNVEDRHPVTSASYSTQTGEVFTFTLTDSPATAEPDVTGVQIGGKDLDQLTSSDLTNGDNATVPVKVEDTDDAGEGNIIFTPPTIPGLSFSGPLLVGGGVDPDGSNYNVTITVDDASLVQLPLTLEFTGTDIHGNMVTATIYLGQQSGGRRRFPTDTTSADIYQLGNDAYIKDSLSIGYTFTDSYGQFTTYGTAEKQACWKVAVDADGKVIPTENDIVKPPTLTLDSAQNTFTAYKSFDESYGLGITLDLGLKYGRNLLPYGYTKILDTIDTSILGTNTYSSTLDWGSKFSSMVGIRYDILPILSYSSGSDDYSHLDAIYGIGSKYGFDRGLGLSIGYSNYGSAAENSSQTDDQGGSTEYLSPNFSGFTLTPTVTYDSGKVGFDPTVNDYMETKDLTSSGSKTYVSATYDINF